MNFTLSDEQRLFQESVDNFVAKEYDIDKRRALIAGEESGGFGFRGHIPERDGVLSGLLLLAIAGFASQTLF